MASGAGVLAHLPWSLLGTTIELAAESQASAGAQIEPFTINVPESVLMDLKDRLARARMPDEPEGVGWRLGTNQAYMKQLVDYWRDEFDWREQERRLNRFEQFNTTIDDIDIHFVHRRSEEPSAFPLILTHGWPVVCGVRGASPSGRRRRPSTPAEQRVPGRRVGSYGGCRRRSGP